MTGAAFMDKVLWRRPERVERVIKDRLNPLEEFSDEKCIHIFLDILNAIQECLVTPSNRGSPIPPVLQLCCTLRYLATGDMQRTVGDSLDLSKSSTCRIIHRVLQAILDRLMNEIKFPQGNTLRQVQEGFFRKFRFPGLAGLIDGTHIRILAPSENEESYVNRKGVHTINNQVTVDDKSIITSVVSRYVSLCCSSNVNSFHFSPTQKNAPSSCIWATPPPPTSPHPRTPASKNVGQFQRKSVSSI